MIILDQAPELILPAHYRDARPAIIRPGVNPDTLFPIEWDRKTRRAFVSDLARNGRIDRDEAVKIATAIPFGMFKPAAGGSSYPTAVQSDSNTANASTNCTVTYTGTVAAGELIMFYSCIRNTGSVTISSGPSGFTQLATSTPAANMTRVAIYYKIAVGGETSSTITYSASSNISVSATRYSGRQGNPEVSATQTAGTTTALFSSLSPSWGSAATKWIAVIFSNTDSSIASPPTGYTLIQTVNASGNNARTTTYHRDLTAASEDPADTTMPTTSKWATYVVAIRPA